MISPNTYEVPKQVKTEVSLSSGGKAYKETWPRYGAWLSAKNRDRCRAEHGAKGEVEQTHAGEVRSSTELTLTASMKEHRNTTWFMLGSKQLNS